MVAAGLMTIMCSLEICLRLFKANKRVQDPDLDNLTNPHEVKHWMDPNLIPYGWGVFGKWDRVEQAEGSPSCVMIPILAGNTREDCEEDQVRDQRRHLAKCSRRVTSSYYASSILPDLCQVIHRKWGIPGI